MINHIVVHQQSRSLIDRQTMALLTGRSVHTIRLCCPVAEYLRGKALYDVDECEKILNSIPMRQRVQPKNAA
jgi:hypothetical protein